MSKLNLKRKLDMDNNNEGEQNLIDKRHKGEVGTPLQLQVFTNLLVLTQITKLLHSKDNLESFRLTSKACRLASSLFWRQNTFVQLLLLPWLNAERNIHTFLQREDEKMPHQNFKLVNWFVHPHSNRGRSFRNTVKCFWDMCGLHIKNLVLNDCKFDHSRLVAIICKFAPNLETLKIQGSVGDYRFPEELKLSKTLQPNINLKVLHIQLTQRWFSNWQFLEYFPNLVELKLIQEIGKFQPAFPSALRILREKYQYSILNLRILKANITESFLDDLAAAKLPLERMSLFLEGYLDDNKFRNMMTSVSGTLKYLKLHRYPFPRHSFQSSFIINFSVLEELHLRGRLVSNFNFLKETPALRKLVVDWSLNGHFSHKCFPNMVMGSNALLETQKFEHLSLENFEVDHSFCEEELQILAKFLPNIKKLTTILNDETLAVVRQLWTKLEDLQRPKSFQYY